VGEASKVRMLCGRPLSGREDQIQQASIHTGRDGCHRSRRTRPKDPADVSWRLPLRVCGAISLTGTDFNPGLPGRASPCNRRTIVAWYSGTSASTRKVSVDPGRTEKSSAYPTIASGSSPGSLWALNPGLEDANDRPSRLAGPLRYALQLDRDVAAPPSSRGRLGLCQCGQCS
jgi:hypothetical protein